jgi:GTP pyrophosphokinase
VTEPGERFEKAVVYALGVHAGHRRKGSGVPYVAHLLGVTSLVLEDHGDEDDAIAAMLHDAVEDGGGVAELEMIREQFGARVAAIVEGCSDVIPDRAGERKPPWLPRKAAYIKHLRDLESDEAGSILRVSMADKVHNLGSTVRDVRNAPDRERFWRVFSTGAAGQLAYYRALTDVYRERAPQSPMLADLDMLIEDLESEMTGEELEKAREVEEQLISGA